MSRARENADGARLDAPLASPTFTGTVAIPNVANLETAVVANTAKTSYDDNVVKTNIALLAFKTAVNGSLAKYSLQDQVIDEYTDATGVDGTPSTNHTLTSGVYSGGTLMTVSSAGTSAQSTDGLYTYYVWTATSGTRTFTNSATLNIDYLIVAGGGAGGSSYSGGGGAGGFKTAASYSLSAAAHAIGVGAGGTAGAGAGSSVMGNNGGNSSIASLVVSTGGGGGGAGEAAFTGSVGQGGSGGGGGGNNKAGATATPSGQGNDGGDGVNTANSNDGGGGGGAAAAGTDAGAGGVGENNVMGMNDADSDAFLTTLSVGHDSGGTRYFAGGGGGGAYGPSGGTGNAGGLGGGGAGSATGTGAAGTVNTGGGGGGSDTSFVGGVGGSGIVIIRYVTSALTIVGDLTLQSTDTEAEAQPTKADMVMLVEDAGSGVGTVNTHIKGYVSRDSGANFTEGVLVDEGDWGADKRILAFHDLDISSQPADQTMCYKITTHSASAVYDTRIHATSIGWR